MGEGGNNIWSLGCILYLRFFNLKSFVIFIEKYGDMGRGDTAFIIDIRAELLLNIHSFIHLSMLKMFCNLTIHSTYFY